jgi:hypothetical protein
VAASGMVLRDSEYKGTAHYRGCVSYCAAVPRFRHGWISRGVPRLGAGV